MTSLDSPDTGAGTPPIPPFALREAIIDAVRGSDPIAALKAFGAYDAWWWSVARSRPALNVDRLAKALHPDGKSPTVDCCMGSTTRAVHGVEEGERLHRLYHHRDAVALAAEYRPPFDGGPEDD